MSLQAANDMHLDAPFSVTFPQFRRGAAGRGAVREDPEHGRTTARHYSRRGTLSYKLSRE